MIQLLFNSTTNKLEVHDTKTGDVVIIRGFVNGTITGSDEVAHCAVPDYDDKIQLLKMIVKSL